MNYGWLAVALVVGGCIEGKDPNSCKVDSDCSGGRLCSQMRQCELAENLVDLTVHWTFNGVAPTSASPGRCADFDSFKVGAEDVNGGFSQEATCIDGVAQLPHVPVSMTTVEASGYNVGA